ncbi:AcrR family transcriptional regulator [Dyadobacter jejuensis]|uniref:Biofilm operon icaADBC HTH-type negative transcriptional regulator IcaR n=1 Tax=Dyadobacter jejuensis TaxID=1082580 RepID=A0A316B4W2_9BACT|nr:TetR family transcriptional regulator [Dyadobacter jejuensis]PWJ57667.1 AcrR family transcriptional regulator [Dyadobacter jejuensis]
MGRKSLKEDRQREIIKVYYKLAKKEGIDNTSIAKIAKAMDINPSLIIHYFRTREDLTYGLIDYILDKYLLIYKVSPSRSQSSSEVLLKMIDNLFSKKWNTLIDDGLFYSCYSLTFRNKRIRGLYKDMLDRLRAELSQQISLCKEDGVLDVEEPEEVADAIFVLVDGAYYYLSLVDNKEEYEWKAARYKSQALSKLRFRMEEG